MINAHPKNQSIPHNRLKKIITAVLFSGAMLHVSAALPLGINIPAPTEEQGSSMFNDLMKCARPWGTPDKPYDGNAVVDADGWPTGDCATLFLAYDTIPPGVYKLKFTGQATIGFSNCNATAQNKQYTAGTNITTADIVVPAGEVSLLIVFRQTSGGLRNLTLLRPGVSSTNPPMFYEPFLKSLEPFSVLRALDYLRVNNTEPAYPGVTTWSSVRPYNYASMYNYSTQTAVVYQNAPNYRYLTDLANVAGKDLWICVPIAATDDYITTLATLLKDNLNANRNVYIEYSNEIWNFGFSQANWNLSAAQAEVANGDTAYNADHNDNKWLWGERRVAKRSLEISKLFAAVWGGSAINTRVRVVMPTGRSGLDFINRYYDPQPEKWFYGACNRAPYMQLSESSPAVTKAQMFAQLRGYSDTTNYRNNKDIAVACIYYNMQPLAYEGGPHLVGGDFLADKIAANRDPLMGDLVYHDMYNNWYAANGGLYCYYNLVSGYGSYGCWGAMERFADMDVAPKYQALKRLATAAAPAISLGATDLPTAGQTKRIPVSNGFWDAASTNLSPFASSGYYAGFLFNSSGNSTVSLSIKYSSWISRGMDFFVNNRAAGSVVAPSVEGVSGWSAPVTITMGSGLQVLRINVTGTGGNGLKIDSVKVTLVSATAVNPSVNQVVPKSLRTGAESKAYGLDGRLISSSAAGKSAGIIIRKSVDGRNIRQFIDIR